MFKDKKVVATIEARMTSSRLPGKVLLDLGGMPVLEFMLRRLKVSRYLDDVVIATTVNEQDDEIVSLCEKLNCSYFRGSEEDVLTRVLDAAASVKTDIIVELTGDCPFIDIAIVDEVIELYFSGDYNYGSNVVERSYPDGFDVEVFSLEDLKKVDKLTQNPIDRVHVSSYFYSNPDQFKLVNLKAKGDDYWPELGVTLDEESDYEFLKALFSEINLPVEEIRLSNVISSVRNKPKLLEINGNVRRKELNEG